jgi:hypothetical protein
VCYVTRERLRRGGSVTSIAMDKVGVWFQHDAMTGTIIREIIGVSIETDFNDYKAQIISFGANGM